MMSSCNNNKHVLSSSQKSMWFDDILSGLVNIYSNLKVFKLKPKMKIELMEKSIESIVKRHEILRTLIKNDDNLYQQVMDLDEKPMIFNKYEYLTIEELDELLDKERNNSFDFTVDYPIRINFYIFKGTTEGMSNYISSNIHHIAVDGWSQNILFNEFMEFYKYSIMTLMKQKYEMKLPELTMQYKDYALWQKTTYFESQKYLNELKYWKEKLNGYETLNLKTDRPRNNEAGFNCKSLRFEIDEANTEGLHNLANKLKISFFRIMLSCYLIMLRAYCNQDDLVVGTASANRHFNGVEHLIGYFINTLVLRVKINAKQKLVDFFAQVGIEVKQSLANKDFPFENLVKEIEIDRTIFEHPIVQVMFTQLVSTEQAGDSLSNFLQPYEPEHHQNDKSRFSIITTFDDSQKILKGEFKYNTSLFNESTIRNYIEAYKEILKQVSLLDESSLGIRVSDLKFPSSINLVNNWNETFHDFDMDITLHAMFEQQVNKTPDHIALIYEDVHLTYKQLNERANQLANYLCNNYKIKADDLIALLLDRSEQMIICILAVLKAGAAYVPISPEYPNDRIEYVLQNTKAQLILSNKKYESRLVNRELANLIYVDVDILQLENESNENPKSMAHNTNLAYVIYTSGTTGNPKGVMIEHRSVLNYIGFINYFYEIGNNETILLISNYVFDVSVEAIFISFYKGHTLVVPKDLMWLNEEEFGGYLNKFKITQFSCTPGFVNQYNGFKSNILKRIAFAGEELKSILYKQIKETSNHVNIINTYGTTETTINSTAIKIKTSDITIGKPIWNTSCYVLDSDMNMVPIGAIGELYIGGVGVARGYLNNTKLTNERFLQNPFQTDEEKSDLRFGSNGRNDRIYKTGDLVRWLPSGDLEYVGRNDFQVKIRGMRVELGEIESVLSSYLGIERAIVVFKRNEENVNDGAIIGYYLSPEEIDSRELMKHMRSKLPQHMCPTMFVRVDSFPMNQNGKIDLKALPEHSMVIKNSEKIMPRNSFECEISKIWAEVLNKSESDIGINDDFFSLGGSSFVAIKLVNSLNRKFNCRIQISHVFSNRTIELLSPYILKTRKVFSFIMKFNNELDENKNKPLLFMIHGGLSGCEVYLNIANKLSTEYICYGIDSFNLYNENRESNLNKLARYYLGLIKTVISEFGRETEPLNLFGWSMGGHLALEISSILESEGKTNINLYALDSWVLRDNAQMSLDDIYMKIEETSLTATQKEDLKQCANAEYTIMKQNISNPLKHTKVTLFKATLEDDQITYNNIDKLISHKGNLELIKMNVGHNEMLTEKEDEIATFLKHVKDKPISKPKSGFGFYFHAIFMFCDQIIKRFYQHLWRTV